MDENNVVPRCVTPDRLMAFVAERNPGLDARFSGIARWYKHFGEAWRVRWDYAFFQMAIETNFLKFRRPDGRRGDVTEVQNNFAGIGATGGGVGGDRFPDVKTGVHAQIQHLVAYSGERLAAPIAPRTQLKQDDIVSQSLRLGRPVTFGDLARRWAVDRNYARSIDYVAGLYRTRYCANAAEAERAPAVPAPVPARRDLYGKYAPPAGLGGPQPAKLAGPDASNGEVEVLPWLQPKEATAPEPAARPQPVIKPPLAIPAKKPAAKHKVPVRTIWSRGEKDASAADTVSTAAKPDDPTARTEAHLVPTSADDEPVTLPTFRIAPRAPMRTEPSRLGGPPPELLAPKTDATASPNRPCRIVEASFGGSKTLLLRATANGEMRYTALTVLDGFEKSMVETYTRANGLKAEIVGEYGSKAAALADASANCPAN